MKVEPRPLDRESNDLTTIEGTQSSNQRRIPVLLYANLTLTITWPLTFQPQINVTSSTYHDHLLYQVWKLWGHSSFGYAAEKQTNRQTDGLENPTMPTDGQWENIKYTNKNREYRLQVYKCDERLRYCIIMQQTERRHVAWSEITPVRTYTVCVRRYFIRRHFHIV